MKPNEKHEHHVNELMKLLKNYIAETPELNDFEIGDFSLKVRGNDKVTEDRGGIMCRDGNGDLYYYPGDRCPD